MLAISMADTPKKVRRYKKKFKVPYPMFSDEHLEVYFKLGRTGTPALILAAIGGKVLWFHYGAIESPEQVLGVINKFLKE
jgi:hypothetical protein